jgi:hypothetical protein
LGWNGPYESRREHKDYLDLFKYMAMIQAGAGDVALAANVFCRGLKWVEVTGVGYGLRDIGT